MGPVEGVRSEVISDRGITDAPMWAGAGRRPLDNDERVPNWRPETATDPDGPDAWRFRPLLDEDRDLALRLIEVYARAWVERTGYPESKIPDVSITARLTGGVLAALAVLHLAWGLGSAFPFRSRRELADAVVGSSRVPPPTACFAVAGALATGAALVTNAIPSGAPVRRASLFGMAAVFGARSALGFSGKTALVSPDGDSERFIHLDRRIYAPICLGLSLGSMLSTGRLCPQT